jgi:hypothetical protein
MKIFLLVRDGPKRAAKLPFPEADHAVVEGKCPACGCEDFKVAGTGRYPSKDDRAWESEGIALCCRVFVGTIRVETNTLFGVREDEAVLRGRCRVY